MKLALWLSAPSAAHPVHLISQVGYRNCAVERVPDACASSNDRRRQAKQPNLPPAVAVTEDVGCEVADAILPVRRRSAGYYPSPAFVGRVRYGGNRARRSRRHRGLAVAIAIPVVLPAHDD